MAHLYIVATPIGNLGDFTFRAVETLKSCHTLACEDTRHSRKLLTHYGISRPLLSCRGQNMAGRIPTILAILGGGGDVAYVSDAGTPGISDPGSSLVRAVRAAGYPVVPLPGPSAVASLVSVSGAAGRGWFFEGFLPPKGKKRRDRMQELIDRSEPVVFYESPHRMARFMAELVAIAPDSRIVLGRELTKIHEQIVSGTVEEMANLIENSEIPLRGEFVILVSGSKSC